ncbi:MAG: DUF883 domain-containing protein [Paracoccaceae bacterium]
MARAATNGGNAEPTTADLQEQMNALKQDIANLGATLGEYGRATGEHLKSAAKDQAQYLRTKGEESVAHAQKTAANAYNQAEDSVRDNPAAAVGIAAAVGFVVGLVAGRR